MWSTKVNSWQAVKVCLVLFAALNSYFAESNQSGALICPSSQGGQYLVLNADYFLTYDRGRGEGPESTSVFEPDTNPLLSNEMSKHGVSTLAHCKEVDIDALIEAHPKLQEAIHRFQSNQGSRLVQGYKIIPIPHSDKSAGINARLSPALAAGLAAMVLTKWVAPGYSEIAAVVSALACFSKPEYCHHAFNSVVSFVYGFLNNPYQAKKVSFRGNGQATGGAQPADISYDIKAVREARVAALGQSLPEEASGSGYFNIGE